MTQNRTRRALFWMVVVALILRLTIMLFVYSQNLDPQVDHWSFGFEEGRVARALASGQGFSNPLYAPTGPTAWFAPVYPMIVAGVFKVFGIYSKASCLAILSFNCLVSALTCIPIFFFARRSFGEGVAKLAGWIWAFFPDAVYGPNSRIWDTWLATLLLATLFLVVLRLEDSDRAQNWIGFGLLSGVAALTSPVLLSVLPILALWMLFRLHQQRKRWLVPALSALFAVLLVVTPWTVRNYHMFHRLIPISDCLGLEIGIGNPGSASYFYSKSAGPWDPWKNGSEWREFREMGEVRYFDWKGKQGTAYIKGHPQWYAGMVARRILNVWTNFWSLSESYLRRDPAGPATVPLYTLLSVLALLGLWRAFRESGVGVAMPYAIVLFFFPLIYYLTHTGDWYRRPIDSFFVVLAASTIVSLQQRLHLSTNWLRGKKILIWQTPDASPSETEARVRLRA